MIGVRLAASTALALCALSLAACGGSDASSSSSAPSSAAPTSGTTSSKSSGTTTSTSTSGKTSTGTTTPSTSGTTSTASTSTSGKTSTTSTKTTPTTGTATGTPSSGSGTTTSTAPATVKSIKQWVSCSETIDESSQLDAAINAAAHNAFVLQIDCPVRIHTGKASLSSIKVPEGVTIKFVGSGEFLAVSGGPDALSIEAPQQVTFVDFNLTYL